MGKKKYDDEETRININLAVAAGWEKMKIQHGKVFVGDKSDQLRVFSYKHKSTLWALAEAYDAFPTKSADPTRDRWAASSGITDKVKVSYASTASMASALAIIEAAKHVKPKLENVHG